MCSSISSDDEQIKLYLAGDPRSVAKGINWIDQNYRIKIAGLLRKRFPGLSPEDLVDVWQDSLIALYRMITQGAFQRDGQLAALIWTLSVRRGQDRIRRNATWHHPIDAVMKELHETQLSEKWHGLDELQRREVVELICDAIERLPPRQNLVWRVYVDHFPNSQRLELLTQEVQKALETQPGACGAREPTVAESPVTRKSVSGALHAGRAKIREDLKRKGYDL